MAYPRDVPSYTPRAKLRIIVRLDEFSDTSKLQAKVPQKSTKNLDGVKIDRTPLMATVDPTTAADVTRFLLLPPGESATNASPQSRARSSDGRTFEFTIVPKTMSIMLNGIRTADALKASIRYLDAPFDPNVLRAVAVEAYLGCLTDDDAAEEARSGTSSLPETWSDAEGQPRTNLRFQGFVETWEANLGDEEEPTIEIECIDNTSLMIHQEAPPRLTLDPKRPIDEAVANYLSNFTQLAGMTVEYQPQADERPILGKILSKTAYRPNLGPQPTHGGASQKLSTWDYLTDVCRAIGHSIYVDGTRIIIQRVRSLMADQLIKRKDDPFLGRLVDGEQFAYRRMIYGSNLLAMRPKRSFQRHVPTNIECRCFSPERKTVLVARFPLPKDRQYFALPGDTTPDAKWSVRDVSGVSDEKTLRAVAQEIYEQESRNEILVELKTRALASFGGDNLDPDLLDLKFGDVVEVLRRRTNDESSTTSNVERVLTAQARASEFMRALGYGEEFADAYAKAYSDAGFVTQYRVRQARFDWKTAGDLGTDGGVQTSLMVVNYVQVRADKALPAGEEPSTTATTSGGQ